MGNTIENWGCLFINRGESVASETLSYRGKNEKNRGCLFICMYGRT